MGKGFLMGAGGGGGRSDDVTASREDVLVGVTAITSDSNDEPTEGTLALTGDAADADVLAGKGFYNTDPKNKRTGTMADRSGTTQSATATIDNDNQRVQLTVPNVGKYSSTSKLYTAFSTLANLIGLTAAKIAKGQSILNIAGTYTSDANANASRILSPYTAYANGTKYTGNIPSKSAQTYTPGRTNQTISSGQYLSGTQTIAGDTDLVAANIKKGVTIFGVTGTWEGYVAEPNYLYKPGLDSGNWTAGNITTLSKESGMMIVKNTLTGGRPSIYAKKTYNLTGYSKINVDIMVTSSSVTGLVVFECDSTGSSSSIISDVDATVSTNSRKTISVPLNNYNKTINVMLAFEGSGNRTINVYNVWLS